VKRLAGWVLAVLMIMPRPAYAIDGELDRTFGFRGKVVSGSSPYRLAIQSNGKIIVAGATDDGRQDFVVARFNGDGSPDSSFGKAGKVTTDLSGHNDYVTALSIQPDGRIVVAGVVGKVGGGQWPWRFGLARYNSDGSLDSSFGIGGKVTTAFSDYQDAASALTIQSDGKIVVSGWTWGWTSGNGNPRTRFVLARYNHDGSLDATFGNGGKVIADTPARPVGVEIGPDNKILVAGGASMNPSKKFDELSDCLQFWSVSDADFVLLRYNPDGAPDASFGVGGIVTADFGELHDYIYSFRIQSDGKIIVAGLTGEAALIVPCDAASYNNSRFTLARYNSNGSLDSDFGNQGIVTTNFSGSLNEWAGAVAIQSDGKIVVTGGAFAVNPDDPNNNKLFDAVFRYNRDGSLDPSFGAGGKVTPPLSRPTVAVQSDGKIVLAGRELIPRQGWDFVLARYDNDSSPSLYPADVRRGDEFTFKFPAAVRNTTYLDVRFRSPGSAADQVALNWQLGVSAEHTVPLDVTAGVWIVTGVRTHEDPNDHGGAFIDVSLPLIVKP